MKYLTQQTGTFLHDNYNPGFSCPTTYSFKRRQAQKECDVGNSGCLLFCGDGNLRIIHPPPPLTCHLTPGNGGLILTPRKIRRLISWDGGVILDSHGVNDMSQPVNSVQDKHWPHVCQKKHVSEIMCVCVCILWVRLSIDMFCHYLCHVGVKFYRIW